MDLLSPPEVIRSTPPEIKYYQWRLIVCFKELFIFIMGIVKIWQVSKTGGRMTEENDMKLQDEVFQAVGEVVLGLIHSGLPITVDDIQARLVAHAEMSKDDEWKSFVYSSAIDSLAESEK